MFKLPVFSSNSSKNTEEDRTALIPNIYAKEAGLMVVKSSLSRFP